MGLLSELKLAVPWGHIAAKAWGSQQGSPVLCLHGWLDNANSFDRLIPLLPKDFHYVAMDFGGHGLSSHYYLGVPYCQENFVNEIGRVVAALKWKRFSLLSHSFGGIIGGMGMENMLTYRRGAIEHMLQAEAFQKPRQVVKPEEMLQRFLKNNNHLNEECGRLLLQRGTTQVATGLMMNRDRRVGLLEYSVPFLTRELLVHSIKQLQAQVLLIKASQGYFNMERGITDKSVTLLVLDTLRSVLKERFQYMEVPGNHYVHLNQPQNVADIISAFLQSKERLPH
ncbi:serine hydrolase-like protein 2 isoform X3 [Canis aureus]